MDIKHSSVNILEIPIYSSTIQDAVKHCIDVCLSEPKLNRCISSTGAHGLVSAKRDGSFQKILQNYYLNLPDGMPLVWVGWSKGKKNIRRCYGPEFFGTMMKRTSEYPIKHYFCGGKEGIAKELADACKKKFSNKNIVGTYCPPFRELSDEELTDLSNDISVKGADIVWIGLSTPKQERFAQRLSGFTTTQFIITVGAAFDFHTGHLRQAPAFLQTIGLEWLFRLTVEPRRLFKRYCKIVPLFLWYNMVEIFFSLLNLKKWQRVLHGK